MSVFDDLLVGADPWYLRTLKAEVERILEQIPAEFFIDRSSWTHHLADINKALVLSETQPFWEVDSQGECA